MHGDARHRHFFVAGELILRRLGMRYRWVISSCCRLFHIQGRCASSLTAHPANGRQEGSHFLLTFLWAWTKSQVPGGGAAPRSCSWVFDFVKTVTATSPVPAGSRDTFFVGPQRKYPKKWPGFAVMSVAKELGPTHLSGQDKRRVCVGLHLPAEERRAVRSTAVAGTGAAASGTPTRKIC
jgi:hypothetical protein